MAVEDGKSGGMGRPVAWRTERSSRQKGDGEDPLKTPPETSKGTQKAPSDTQKVPDGHNTKKKQAKSDSQTSNPPSTSFFTQESLL